VPQVSASDWQKSFQEVQGRISAELDSAGDLKGLEDFRVRHLGRKGSLTMLLRSLKDLPLEERKKLGPEANRLKGELEQRITDARGRLESQAQEKELEELREDLSLPPRIYPRGRRHPITLTMERMAHVLSRIGFSWAEGPLVESDHYNFGALNIPPEHPARDLQDTYYVETAGSEAPSSGSRGPNKPRKGEAPPVMRTHTSPVQIRAMEGRTPPIRVMAPGRVFRHEAVDATHSHVFHQVEGLYIDKRVSMADLRGTLDLFMKEMFGPETKIRFRPSYFPFVEPGAEVDVSCLICHRKKNDCAVCKGTGFLEMLGAGLVHPKVLEAAGQDPSQYSGFAFGIGVERVAMMLFGVGDIRLFYENDVRFLRQFG